MEEKKVWSIVFISIFIASIGLNLGQQMTSALLSLYAYSLGSDASQIGMLISIFAVSALLFRFFTGPLMNAFNRKRLLQLTMLLYVFVYLGFGMAMPIANLFGLLPVHVLMGFRLLQGVGVAFGNSVCMLMVSDVLPKEKFSTGLGYFSCAQAISQAIGPAMGVWCKDLCGYEMTFQIFAGVMLVTCLMTSGIKMPKQFRAPFSMALDNIFAKEAILPATVTFFIALGISAINGFLLVYAEFNGIVGGALFFTVYAITLLVTRPLAGKWADKYGFVAVAVPALCITGVSFSLIAMSKSLWMLLLAAAVNACGYGAIYPLLHSLCMKSVPISRRGSATSTNYFFMDMATISGPNICGAISDYFGYGPHMWFVMIIPIAIGVLFILAGKNRIKQIERAFQSVV